VTNPANYATWQAMVLAREGLKTYMLTTKVLNDGKPTDLTLTQILAQRPVSAWAEKLDYMKVMSTPSVEINGTVQLRQSNGYYDTFTIPAMKNTIKTSVVLTTPYNLYQILPDQIAIDIPVTISGKINYGGLPMTYMTVSGVAYKGYTAPLGSKAESAASANSQNTFLVRIYRQDLNQGINAVCLNGSADFASIFMNDPNPIIKTGSKTIQIFLGEGTPEIIPDPPEPPGVTDISGEADLILPPYTFEGHPTLAEDASSLLVDGEGYSAARAYAEGLASNRFSVLEHDAARVVRIKSTAAEMTFDNPGTYTGRLEVNPDGGEELSDQESIQVLETPAIKETLSGVQKDNRKQILTIAIALNPAYPLEDFYLEIEQIEGLMAGSPPIGDPVNNRIHLSREETQQNSALIKTRLLIEAIQIEGGEGDDPYFAKFSLEFLTKNPGQILNGTDSLQPASFLYTIYAKDSRGREDLVIRTFLVDPDLPPLPVIAAEETYIRNPGENLAEIIATDATVSADGDQLDRTWGGNFTLMDLQDLSFGTRKKVSFKKEGVGPLTIGLSVKEVWIEPTLEEYVSEADHKTAETAAETEVINVAPLVSLSPIDAMKAHVLILSTGEEDFETLKNTASYQQEFLRNGIDADMTIERICEPVLKPAVPTSILTVNSAYGYEGRWTFLEEEGYTLDDQRLYIMEATWPGTGLLDYPMAPFKVSAYAIHETYDALNSGQGGVPPALEPQAAWTYTINEDTLVIDSDSTIALGHDDQDAFLYIICDGKTLLLDKKTGAFQAVLNFEAGKKNYVTAHAIYTIKREGIYAISRSSGSVRKITSAPAGGSIAENAKRIGDQINYLMISGNTLKRGLLDAETETVILATLPGTQTDPYASTYDLLDIDAFGRMIIHQMPKESGSCTVTTRVFDEENRLIKSIEKAAAEPSQFKATPVMDEGGNCSYINYCSTRKSTSYYYFEVDTRGVMDSFSSSSSYRSSSKYLANDLPIFIQKSGSKIHLIYGGIWDYIYNTGYMYDERAAAFVVDIPTGTTTLGNASSYGLDPSEEFGRRADLYSAVQSSGNSTTNPGFRTRIMAWNQNLWQVMARTISKYLGWEDGLNYVVISDQNHELAPEGAQPEAWALPDSPYKAALMSSLSASGATLLFTSAPDPISIRDEIIANKAGMKNVLHVTIPDSQTTAPNPGYMIKTVPLKAATTYFYEYDLKASGSLIADGGSGINSPPETDLAEGDVLDAVFLTNKALPDSQLLEGGYYVTQMMEEDFNDPVINRFFMLGSQTKVQNGVYKACDANTGKSTSSSMRVLTDTIRFTIPEGKQAILAMDYDYALDLSMINGNRLTINGVPWEPYLTEPASGKGRFYHKALLPAGEVVLGFNVTYYGRLPESYKFFIDNLAVMFVDEDPMEPENPPAGVTALENGWSHISGSFTTPLSTLAFRPQIADIAFEDFNDQALIPYLSVNTAAGTGTYSISGGEFCHPLGRAGSGVLDFSMPTGKLGQARINTWSNVRRSSVSYTMDGKTWLHNLSVTEQSPYRNMGSPYSILPPAMAGIKSLTVQNSYQDLTGIKDLELTSCEENPLTLSGKFFVDKDNGRLYLENDTFGGEATLRLTFADQAAYSLQNFKIYAMENGVKTYVSEDYFTDSSAPCGWAANNAELGIQKDSLPVSEEQSLIYQKGELIAYNIGYYDYEADPSKKQYWRYTHLPSNDGLHPEAGKILNEPIDRFYIDGKYTVEHWQEDNTTRGLDPDGNPLYDKVSNVETITFYIQGSGAAPWITYIKTVPGTVKEGGLYKLEIGVNDLDLEVLNLTTEVYNKNGKLIYTHEKEGILPADGHYPATLTANVTNGGVTEAGLADTKALAGKYRVVCTVRDASGTGLGTASYLILTDGRISGEVRHTAQWDDNRRRSNLARYGVEENLTDPNYGLAPRGCLVFWSGEKFVLAAETEGEPTSVKAEILEEPGYEATLLRQAGGSGSSGSGGSTVTGPLTETWAGELWDETMINKWGRSGAQNLTIRFTATYTTEMGTSTKTHDVRIIVYNPEDFWQLHRVW
jgi:hypothetical protein